MEKIEKFKRQFPQAYFFDEKHLGKLSEYLTGIGILKNHEEIKYTEKPGEGNMNFVRRVVTNRKSFILKQAHSWVEKYPDIPAPVERLRVEAAYYQRTRKDPFFHPYTPALLYYDAQNLTLIFEDLGAGTDFLFAYQKAYKIHENDLIRLVQYLSRLHHLDWNGMPTFPDNLALRQLNHEHIFYFPYHEDNGFDLDEVQPGLQKISDLVKSDNQLKSIIAEFGQRYLSTGSVLIHGDFYPGSWLSIGDSVKVIDPEFAFVGFAEFDIGVMSAHLLMTGLTESQLSQVWKHYQKRAVFNAGWCTIFCGIELLRRLIGLAQLPISFTLDEKSALIKLAIKCIKAPKTHEFI